MRIALLAIVGLAVTACVKSEPPFWSTTERSLLRSISLSTLSPPPTAYSNRVSEDPRAAALGKALFFDKRLSAGNDFSCATCHQPQLQFTDGFDRGMGVNPLPRNTPSLIGGAWQSWFYWDGRRDSLWSQALIPIEAPDEMGGSRSGAVRLIAQDKGYLEQYTALFGPLPPALTSSELPVHAGEFTDAKGKDAWYRLPPSTQQAINRAYANIGKTIAAFERELNPKPGAFDRYVEALDTKGERAAAGLLSSSAINGAKLFIDIEKTRCMQCHNGSLLTNGDFHNVGSGTLSGTPISQEQPLDFGRLFGVQAVLLDQFNCLGPHSDANPEQCSALRFLSREQHGGSAGAFKTPSLRNVAQTAPYFHNGQLGTLEDVMQHYIAPPNDDASELTALNLSTQEIKDLIAFLSALSSPAYTELSEQATK